MVCNAEGDFDGSKADQWKELPLEVGADLIRTSHRFKVALEPSERAQSRA